jgi:chromosome partitioning protein
MRNYQNLKRHETLFTTILEKNPLPIHPTSVPNLEIVPSHILLSNTDVELTTALDHREARLKAQLDKIKTQYDYVFIDCPPALSWLTLNAFTASDQVVIVISPGYFELESVLQIMKTINEVQINFNADLKIRGLLFALSDSTVNSKTSLKVLRQAYPEYVLNTVVPRNVALKDASMNQQDIYGYDPDSTGAQAYNNVVEEIFNGT